MPAAAVPDADATRRLCAATARPSARPSHAALVHGASGSARSSSISAASQRSYADRTGGHGATAGEGASRAERREEKDRRRVEGFFMARCGGGASLWWLLLPSWLLLERGGLRSREGDVDVWFTGRAAGLFICLSLCALRGGIYRV